MGLRRTATGKRKAGQSRRDERMDRRVGSDRETSKGGGRRERVTARQRAEGRADGMGGAGPGGEREQGRQAAAGGGEKWIKGRGKG
jgi:hypothetical protein